jgi:hypothetical protein
MKAAAVLALVVLATGCTPATDRFITIEERGIDAGALSPVFANIKSLTVREGEKPMRSCVAITIAQKGRTVAVQTPACE